MARRSNGPWYRRSKGAWFTWHDGKLVSLGVKGELNKPEAMKAWHLLMAGGHQDRPVAPSEIPRPRASAGVTVRQVADGFLADISERAKPRTVKVYRFLLTALNTRCGDRRAESLTPADVEGYSRKPTWSVTTRRCFIDAALAAFRWAADRRQRLVAENPLIGIRKPPKASRGRSAVMSEEDLRLLTEKANPALRSLLVLLWETGARPSELCRMTAADVDLANAVAILTEHKTGHTGRPRLVVLTPTALEVLRPLVVRYPVGPLVRRRNGTAWNEDTLNAGMRALRRRAGVAHATAYGFRHTFATDALVKGLPDAQVAALLGHSSTAMLHKHYSHLTGQSRVLRDALAKVRGEHPPKPGK